MNVAVLAGVKLDVVAAVHVGRTLAVLRHLCSTGGGVDATWAGWGRLHSKTKVSSGSSRWLTRTERQKGLLKTSNLPLRQQGQGQLVGGLVVQLLMRRR